ncbi:hypothetical protein MNBD_GAMMA06-1019 [hydrothermal vent metagenome]|uniref:Carboxypeptidase regulatory-like domain-containing protein n=1 Tax=hydrothermal vent metagenome TaxID=652676 RepID=A0A3B0WNU3_9ZZZZ
MNKISNFYPALIGFLYLLLIACSGGGGGGSSSAGGISGRVINGLTGLAVPNAIVSAGDQNVATGADGSYTLENIALNDRVIVSAFSDGFAEQFKIVRVSSLDEDAILLIRLLPVGLTQTFDPDAAQTLTVPGTPASVSLGAGALAQADGSAPSGNVTINLTVVDPRIDIDLMPGDMLVDAGAGELSPIESFGAIIVTFTDAAGSDLDLAQGSNATIRIPLADKSGSPPATIPLYFYDEDNGVWLEEGSASLDDTNSYYEGTVSHFSTWNADFLYPQTLINGCVEDVSGEVAAGVSVVSVGDNYSGVSTAVTDASGNFSIIVKPDAVVLLSGLRAGIKTNTISITTTSSDQTVDECLMFSVGSGGLGAASVSIKLSWGENPFDLDSYLIGPDGSGVSINFITQGSLIEFPFSQLDVDDTDSFGPEIITVFSFPVAGIYRYSVNNFSGTFEPGITGSPARVELNANGNVTLYTPPAGEGTNFTWDVFDINVAADGSFVIIPANTWSALSP